MIAAYTALYRAGGAHSVEVWKNDALVGGLYGVDAGGFFGGESMFHLEDNASKLAIWFLAGYLRERGQAWLDIQQLTPHMERLGAKEITRARFLAELENELSAGRTLFPKL
jgi:leucyl/phenylalanyl-tRNA--protein transferase